MNVAVKLFAAARDCVDQDVIHVEVADQSTVADLRSAIAAAYPELEPILQHTMFAIDADYADDATIVQASQEIACIPPVSGG